MSDFLIHDIRLGKSDFSVETRNKDSFSIDESSFMSSFFHILTSIILEIQKKGLGINKIGNVIRYDKKFQDLFSTEIGEAEVKKAFENRRYTDGLVLSILERAITENQETYLLILQKEFRKKSKLVDSSAITLDDVLSKLEELYKTFQLRKECTVYIIEIISIPGHRFTPDLNGKYSILSKIY